MCLPRRPACLQATSPAAFAGAWLRRSSWLTRLALVLQGGGALGAYEYGAARALYENSKFSPDLIAGVSIGAISAVLLARPGGGRKPLEALQAFWERIFSAIRGV